MMPSQKVRGNYGIILALTFVVVFSVMIQSMNMVNRMEYSEYRIPLWKGEWRDTGERFRVYMTFQGKLSREEFPVPYFGPSLPVGGEKHPIYTDVYIIEELSGYGPLPEKVYIWHGGKTGMFLAYSGGDWKVGGRLVSEWLQALAEGWTVEVEGRAFDVIQDGSRITLFEVENLLSTQKSEIVYMYEDVHASSHTGGVRGVSFIPLPTPTWFKVGRLYKDGRYMQDNDVYRGVWLESGETIKYYFKSFSDPISFQLIYSNCSSFDDWDEELTLIDEPSTTTRLSDLTAEWDGFYIFGFRGGDPAPIVMFSAYRETDGEVLMPAWLLGGKTGGGSGHRYDVNMTDLLQFPHLIEAFEEDAKSSAVHADHATYCPAEEAYRIIEFFGEEYVASDSDYWYKLTSEDGSFYAFSMTFSWVPPIID
jgi:hypothetical protein